MGKHGYKDLFNGRTVLDGDFIKNEMAFDLDVISPHEQTAIFNNYYVDICKAIANDDLHYLRPSPDMIEQYLTDGFYNTTSGALLEGSIKSNITNPEQLKYYFLLAQGNQLLFDKTNGRTSMLRGEDLKWVLCEDTRELLYMIGLIDNGTLFRG